MLVASTMLKEKMICSVQTSEYISCRATRWRRANHSKVRFQYARYGLRHVLRYLFRWLSENNKLQDCREYYMSLTGNSPDALAWLILKDYKPGAIIQCARWKRNMVLKNEFYYVPHKKNQSISSKEDAWTCWIMYFPCILQPGSRRHRANSSNLRKDF